MFFMPMITFKFSIGSKDNEYFKVIDVLSLFQAGSTIYTSSSFFSSRFTMCLQFEEKIIIKTSAIVKARKYFWGTSFMIKPSKWTTVIWEILCNCGRT